MLEVQVPQMSDSNRYCNYLNFPDTVICSSILPTTWEDRVKMLLSSPASQSFPTGHLEPGLGDLNNPL